MTTPMDLEGIRERAEKASPGPWNVLACQMMYEEWNAEDGEFIAHARTDVPLLLAEVERLRAESARLTEAVRSSARSWDEANRDLSDMLDELDS